MPTRKGSIFLFRLFGVSVYLHYYWFLVAAYVFYSAYHGTITFSLRPHPLPYQILLYLCLFLIVLIHEFGHSLAAKSVGGTSDTIVLFPFGGVSYAQPPQRAGATLWTIVAGPLVNVILVPITFVPLVLLHVNPIFGDGTVSIGGDLLYDIACLNLSLLIFNILPIYPLDGGQILRSLLWFIVGRATSLIIAAVIGLVCSILGALALGLMGNLWLAAMGAFLAMQAYTGLRVGLAMLRIEHLPRRIEARCPYCLKNPPVGPVWRCQCGQPYDLFEHHGQCPRCATQLTSAPCPWCERGAPLSFWYASQNSPLTPMSRVPISAPYPPV